VRQQINKDVSRAPSITVTDSEFKEIQNMENHSVEISVKGKWFRVPALNVSGKDIILKGKWVKVAFVHAEEWLVTEVEDPALCVKTLKSQGPEGLRADVFTFSQKLPTVTPKYSYPVERDSIAAIHVTSFENWWDNLPQETRKNVRRAEKRGIVVQVKSLDAGLLQGLVELNNDSAVRQGKVYTHYGKTLEQVTRDQADFLDRCDYICAYVGDELVGVVKLIYRGGVASILTFLPKASHHDKRPANALMAITLLLNVRTRWQEFRLSRCSSTSEQPNRIRQMGRSIPPAGSTT
jgi:hypothetical protein